MKTKYINPFTDFGFKKLFGEEANKHLLIDFLNQLLPPQHQIHDLFYKKTEQLGSHELDRKAIFDLYCESQDGHKFIVELQKAKQNFLKIGAFSMRHFQSENKPNAVNGTTNCNPCIVLHY